MDAEMIAECKELVQRLGEEGKLMHRQGLEIWTENGMEVLTPNNTEVFLIEAAPLTF